ncbi:MAG: ribonuclease HI [Planctomycetota bacterium]
MDQKQSHNKYYVVVKGRERGIYRNWNGEEGAAARVKGFSGAQYRGFKNSLEARWWLEDHGHEDLLDQLQAQSPESQCPVTEPGKKTQQLLEAGKVVIYTDGAAINNPGPGGYGAILRYQETSRELSGGFRRTTNNRMELLGCIKALASLKRECEVVLHSDSRYVVNVIAKGWAARWKANEWKRNRNDMASNVDLWALLLNLSERHEVRFQWVKGHAGNRDNERCDQLATKSARGGDLGIDRAYERDKTTHPRASTNMIS